MVQPPVIVVPGITASGLEDFYPIPPEIVWSAIAHKRYERISLHPDDQRYEAAEPARVQPRALFGIVYDDFVSALRHDLSKRPDKPTPVFAFNYDWRQDCTLSADQLKDFIDEVLARTRLLPHYKRRPPTMVDLVGHSMGGIIISDYLARHGQARKNVRKVVTIGTPFEGAIDAILKLATGMGRLTGEMPRDREREAARTFPALYQLLPTFKDAIHADRGLSDKIFEIGTWQPSILGTLKQYIRLHKASITPEALFQGYLSQADQLRTRIRGLTPADVLPDAEDGWLPIVGVGAKTQVDVRISLWKRKPWWLFNDEEVNEGPTSERTGDGTVPFLGACPRFLKRERLVCVTPGDFSFWEFKDRALAAVAGFHGTLPTVNLVQRLVVTFLRTGYDSDVWAHPAPGVTKPRWPRWLKED